jgi:hypothetical protein
MDIGTLLKELFTDYGAPALPWTVVAYLGWMVLSERKPRMNVPKEYQELMDNYHDAIVENTRAMERLSLLIEERTRRQLR